MKDYLLIIGIMTGNSLDAADVVLTKFYKNGKIEDVESFSLPASRVQYDQLKALRSFVNDLSGDMETVSKTYPDFEKVLESYTCFVADAVEGLLKKAGMNATEVDLIGFHGQTCAHLPPSQSQTPYTVQLGDGKKLADLTGISVAFDFRSDDLMAGGEGAPLAPMHNKHIAEALGFPITFINGGNTSNIAHIVDGKAIGWDAGPFNHFPDMLMRKYFDVPCDLDGNVGRTGTINKELLRQMFEQSAVMANGGNFLEARPPKSSDPQWYKNTGLLDDENIPAKDKIRTAECFAAYLTFHSLGHTPADMPLPKHIAVFGGGWKNPVVMEDFTALMQGKAPLVLPEHQDWFDRIQRRLSAPTIKFSQEYGVDGAMMEARIFADLARCLVLGYPFTTPELTGANRPVVLGVMAYSSQVTENLKAWIAVAQTNPPENAARWSRASK